LNVCHANLDLIKLDEDIVQKLQEAKKEFDEEEASQFLELSDLMFI
jgi:hypothetical protein